MKLRITKPGIFGATGEIPVGTEVTVKEEPKGWGGRYEVLSGSAKGKTAVTNPAKEPTQQPAYEAKHRGGGSYSVMDGETEVVQSLSKEGAEAFNAMSDEDKVKFVAENKAAD